MKLLIGLMLCGAALAQQNQMEGLWKGYDGEWEHVSYQLAALAEAIPAEKYSWSPAPGVRSVAEVLNHLTTGNYWLLSRTGVKQPDELQKAMAGLTAKPEIIAWLKRSNEAVRAARAGLKPQDLARVVKMPNGDAAVDGVYLRILIHANEHMGQLVAYARSIGVTPPWSEPAKK